MGTTSEAPLAAPLAPAPQAETGTVMAKLATLKTALAKLRPVLQAPADEAGRTQHRRQGSVNREDGLR